VSYIEINLSNATGAGVNSNPNRVANRPVIIAARDGAQVASPA